MSIFGGARVAPCDEAYRLGRELARRLGGEGFAIITGGGPGVMESANRGAREAGVPSIGLNIKLPHEQDANRYADTVIDFDYFFARKVMFVKYACAAVMLPGGFGTLDELFECLTLKQTQKMKDIPVILVGSDYWSGLIGWLKEQVLGRGLLAEQDFDLFHLVDTAEEVVELVTQAWQHIQRDHSHQSVE